MIEGSLPKSSIQVNAMYTKKSRMRRKRKDPLTYNNSTMLLF